MKSFAEMQDEIKARMREAQFTASFTTDWIRTTPDEPELSGVAGDTCKVVAGCSGLHEGEIVTMLSVPVAVQQPGFVLVARASRPRRAYSVPAVALVRWDCPHPAPRPSWARRHV